MVGRIITALMLAALLCGCPSKRAPVPPGTVPYQAEIRPTDEQYGHEVLAGLMEQYKLDDDDSRVERARHIVENLSAAAHADNNPWHVYVFKDATFKNAAATRGNYIFVWSALIDMVQSDDELATVLAHEMGHVLAGHTEPDPADEINQILSGVSGSVAREIALRQGGSIGLAADLAQTLISESVKALIINPESQRKELEADHIGLFMMADAGYDPELAIDFWGRVQGDPSFSSVPLAFLSSHPSTADRFKRLRDYLPSAIDRYRDSTGK